MNKKKILLIILGCLLLHTQQVNSMQYLRQMWQDTQSWYKTYFVPYFWPTPTQQEQPVRNPLQPQAQQIPVLSPTPELTQPVKKQSEIAPSVKQENMTQGMKGLLPRIESTGEGLGTYNPMRASETQIAKHTKEELDKALSKAIENQDFQEIKKIVRGLKEIGIKNIDIEFLIYAIAKFFKFYMNMVD